MKTEEFLGKYFLHYDDEMLKDFNEVVSEATASQLQELVTLRSENETLKQQVISLDGIIKAFENDLD